MKTKDAFKLFLSLSVISSSFVGAFANDAVLNSDPIDINGYVSEAPATDNELEKVRGELRRQKQTIQINKQKSKKYKELGRTTEKLADVTEDLIEERKEATTTIDKYNKKIECLMQENPGSDCDEFVRRKDTVSMKMAAPAPAAQVVAEVQTETKMGDVIKVLPYAGITSIQSDNENLEAGMNIGLRVESDISDRFSVGLGINYTTLKTTDYANGNQGYMNDPRYSAAYTGGREIEYSNINFDMYSKFFITKTNRFRPYIGGGIVYNRTNAKYADNNTTQFSYGGYNSQFGDEEVTANAIAARLMGGTEILFTKNIGLNLELQYSKALGEGFGNKENNVEGFDQVRLRELNDEINTAHTISVTAGVLVLF